MKKFSPKACKIMMSLVHEISSAISITNWTGVNVHRLITALYRAYIDAWACEAWVGLTLTDVQPSEYRESFFSNFSCLGSHLYQELVQSLLWEHGFQVDILVPHEGYEFLVVFPQNLPFNQCRVRHSGFGSMCCKQAVRGRNTSWWEQWYTCSPSWSASFNEASWSVSHCRTIFMPSLLVCLKTSMLTAFGKQNKSLFHHLGTLRCS